MTEPKRPRRTNAERTRETRARILWAGRQLMATGGYAGASTPAIVTAAKVTRGAMYHHFADKPALFVAIVETELKDVGERMTRAAKADPDPVEQLILGGEAFVLAMAEAGRRRILLIEGPSVLGAEKMEALQAGYLKAPLEAGVSRLMASGQVAQVPVDQLVDLLTALFNRIALVADRESFTHYRLALRALVNGLKAPPKSAGDFILT
jgi:AcrR family transcriptional regulator